MNINNPTTFGTPNLTLSTSNSSGTGGALRSDDTILVYDASAVDAITFGQSGSVGSASTSSRRDHAHAMVSETFSAAASEAEMVSASITTKPVTPGRVTFSPFALKVWGKFSQSGAQSILITEGLATIADTASGTSTLTFDDDFNGVNYAFNADTSSTYATAQTFAAGSVVIAVKNQSHVSEDSSEVSIMLAGVWA